MNHRDEWRSEIDDDTEKEVQQVSTRPDLCAVACMDRISRFMRDECERQQDSGHHERFKSGLAEMRFLVDALINDIKS